MFLRLLIFLHRWMGIAICLVFLLWFPSGIGMMYWGYPSVSPADRLDRSPKLDPSKVLLSPVQAAAKLGIDPSPGEIRLNTFNGRPVYRFGDGGMVYADTGEEQIDVSTATRDRTSASWT